MLRVFIFFGILIAAFVYVLGATGDFFNYDIISLLHKKEQWIGFFYENKLSTKFIKSDPFNSIDDCKKWAVEKIKMLNLIEGTYRYECGKNCQFYRNFSSYFCRDLVKINKY